MSPLPLSLFAGGGGERFPSSFDAASRSISQCRQTAGRQPDATGWALTMAALCLWNPD